MESLEKQRPIKIIIDFNYVRLHNAHKRSRRGSRGRVIVNSIKKCFELLSAIRIVCHVVSSALPRLTIPNSPLSSIPSSCSCIFFMTKQEHNNINKNNNNDNIEVHNRFYRRSISWCC